MPKRRKNRIREERIHNEVIIDAYGPEENIRLRRPHAFDEASPGTGLFERREENPPLREAIDFYRQAHGWSNRLIAGDSLLVMNSLLEKKGMAGQQSAIPKLGMVRKL